MMRFFLARGGMSLNSSVQILDGPVLKPSVLRTGGRSPSIIMVIRGTRSAQPRELHDQAMPGTRRVSMHPPDQGDTHAGRGTNKARDRKPPEALLSADSGSVDMPMATLCVRPARP